MKRRLVIALVLLIISAGPALAAGYSIVLNQASPAYGQTVTFTSVYPKVATIKVGRQQMFNPAIQVDCMVNNVRVWSTNTSMATAKQNGDGTLTGVSGPVMLGGTANGWTWTSGPASCQATLYYFSRDKQTGGLTYNYLASTVFDVSA